MTTTALSSDWLQSGAEPVLCWAAGLDVAPPDDLAVDSEVLLDLVGRHALTGRLLRRVESTPLPTWMSLDLHHQLISQYVAGRALLESHAESASEIASELRGEPEPVLVKGISTYLVTRQPHTVRCGDIDLVCADGERLIEVLTRLGYHRTRDPFMHEIGEFTRGQTEVDLHSYFPVHGYPGDLLTSDLDPARQNRVWHQPGHRMSMHRIEHQDLDRERLRRSAGRSGEVSVPDPCLLAIILCAHAFMNFTNVWSISHRAKPYVRLGELADLQDLASNPAFNRDRFLQLVQQFNASDAVRWAGWASTLLLGRNPLPSAALEPTAESFPRCLWWSFWANTPVAPEVLVNPGWLDLGDLVPALRGSVVHLTDGATGRLDVNPATQLYRQFRLQSDAPIPTWAVDVIVSDGGLTVAVGLPARSAAAIERVRVDLGSVATEWSLTSATGRQSVTGGHVSCRLGQGEQGRRLEIHYAGPSFGRSVGAVRAGRIGPDGLSLLVGIADEDSAGIQTSSVLLPLTLRLDHAVN
jgi:hypothetical protein